MLARKGIKLREITLGEFRRLNNGDGYLSKEAGTKISGFAQIVEPISYLGFETLLYGILETEFARFISMKLKGKWTKVRTSEISDIDYWADRAYEAGSLFVHFVEPCRRTHEIEFKNNGSVTSSKVTIPGKSRDEYSWNGSDKDYSFINGIWVPH